MKYELPLNAEDTVYCDKESVEYIHSIDDKTCVVGFTNGAEFVVQMPAPKVRSLLYDN